ncbi:phospholipid scramblase 1-like isoform X2 [Ostrea edulis]|uniref:phospholipid scramblase 1-like isoform X2 n=1 Tax=Ostrea edulis TaxID=37623 RepID=UPI0024AECBF1|nr:phospholipid scramblase 1-like isoform X2 [Ostrea edulis]XP_048777763.2 phospholipid scramblase 1-like isoform X2 [Ostrea edulis]
MEKIPITSQPDNETLPPGLKDLGSLGEITVHQHLEAGDMCFQRPSRYSVYGQEEDSILYAQEVSECYARQCLGAMRAFVLKFSNQDGQDVVRLRRPLRCPCGVCWWWCCCVQELTIESPPGHEIGAIMEDRYCCPSYKIIDESESVVYQANFSCCLCKMCSDVVIPVFDGRGEQRVAEIKKKTEGDCGDLCGTHNDFTITYLKPLEVKEKILLLGASFLMDFNFFEKQQRSCC